MSIMANVAKLVRANKFTLETVLFKVGEDKISDAFARAADEAETAQVVLTFPKLDEEQLPILLKEQESQKKQQELAQAEEARRRKEKEEHDRLKSEWLNKLFTDRSLAAMSSEVLLPVTIDTADTSAAVLIVWVGDDVKADDAVLHDLPSHVDGSARLLALAWPEHPAAEALLEINLAASEVSDGSWYLRDKAGFDNSDLDLLHDCELLARSLVGSIQPLLRESGLEWRNVIIAGFGKGAGIALYAVLMRLVPHLLCAMVLFSPVVIFPSFLARKLQSCKQQYDASTTATAAAPTRIFTVWGSRNRYTPATYRQLLASSIKKAKGLSCIPDTISEGTHSFDGRSFDVFTSLLKLCSPC
eukprot:gnl/TRDRNA2_/TRDRNA2_92640_c1_seq2.p1 gnl/TRDRNA2_/TRDRNA2_92640_c1~~gnl/TRDRNA2_/TRDRNA2_92640_c1_seq2.p1  ORF type:complete len:367 (+),score=81.50 gnl/TRDRNA2_/TRDRNA2_92640_c1_seq2:29-1102(+)